MSDIVISIENLSKSYHLGQIGTGTLTNDLKLWWAKRLGKPNPLTKVGEQELGHRYGETIWALKDVNFSVEQGETLGIIGRNGAGKSTLLKILSQVTAPTKGRVKIKGHVGSLLEVGTGFHPDLTGRENIFLNGAIMGMTRSEVIRKFDEIVDFSGVERFIDTPVKRYSSGMYVRLAFAVAAHLDPEILVVDEVLAVGDAEFQKKCLGKMGEVSGEGRTVLFVSHNMAAIQKLCQKGLYLESGHITEIGNISQIVNRYLSSSKGDSLIWENNDQQDKPEAYFRKIYIADEDWNPAKVITTSDTIRVVMEFTLQKELRNLHLSLDLLDQYGSIIFVTAPPDQNIKPLTKKGNYRYRAIFPVPILLPKSYTIRVNLFDPKAQKRYHRVERINFKVEEIKEIPYQFGTITLKCDWLEG